ncbi:MAG: hypothetical protein WCT28_01185 [Patescibacteria group bacterium]|jgi:hypothetical protein
MATGGTAQQPKISQDSGATLRMDYMSSLRSRIGKKGRVAILGLSMMQASPMMPEDKNEGATQRDPVAELQAGRHTARRYANPGASAPLLQMATESLRNEGDEHDQEAANDIEESVDDITEEAAQTEDTLLTARAKSELKSKANKVFEDIKEKGMKEFQKTMAKAKTEGAAKFASAADDGEFFEIPDTLGTGASVLHAGLSIFQDSMNKETKEMFTKLGFPMLKMDNALDLAIITGTNMQILKWSAIVVVIIPFCVVFIVMTIGTMCKVSIVCNAGTGAISAITNLISL